MTLYLFQDRQALNGAVAGGSEPSDEKGGPKAAQSVPSGG